MPPVQCPECGRFLSNAFVAGLEDKPAPCPKCEVELTADRFADVPPAAGVEPEAKVPEAEIQEPAPIAPESEPGAAVGSSAAVRPPDLAPTQVRESDPLEGWDTGPGDVVDLDRHRAGGPDGATMMGAAVGAGATVGAVVGALISDRRGRGALLGALVGAVGAAVGARATGRDRVIDHLER